MEGDWGRPVWKSWWHGCPRALPRLWATGAEGSQQASVNGWRWPGRSFANAPLLLDEPTASLDGDTEMDVVDAVGRLAKGRTVLMVAHRPALISLATQVVELGPETVPA